MSDSPSNIVLSVEDATGASKLSPVFDKFQGALIDQKGVLVSNWISHNQKEITIEVEKILEFIAQIGVKKEGGYKKEEEILLQLLYDTVQKLSKYHSNIVETIRKNNKKTKQIVQQTTSKSSSKSKNKGKKKNKDTSAKSGKGKIKKSAEQLKLEKDLANQRDKVSAALAKAEPQLKKSKDAVSAIDDATLNELLSFSKPPPIVSKVLTVVAYVISESDLISTSSGRSTPRSPRSRSVARERTSSRGSARNRTSSRGSIRAKSPKSPKAEEAFGSPLSTPRYSYVFVFVYICFTIVYYLF